MPVSPHNFASTANGSVVLWFCVIVISGLKCRIFIILRELIQDSLRGLLPEEAVLKGVENK